MTLYPAGLLCLSLLSMNVAMKSQPWWNQFPAITQTESADRAAQAHSSGVLCGAADDPTWGLFAQRIRIADSNHQVAKIHAKGMKALVWIEAFGTAGACYIAQVKRNADGTWQKMSQDPTVTRLLHNHWNWQEYDGTGEIKWIGAQNYFGDEDFARPYTRTNPRYGAPPMRYPDGREAEGYNGSPADPRNSRIYDAGCSKDVLGQITFDYEFNAEVNRILKETGKPRGPLDGLIRVDDAPVGVPDPGYTPEEWARLRKQRYAGAISPGKDAACPMWIDYAKASVRQALDAGVDGLWVDNWSPWDSFSGKPIQKAFGDWSVAGFRIYLLRHFSPKTLAEMGVGNSKQFDVRACLRDKVRRWGGDPTNLDDPKWSDPRWQDDPVWRAYLVYRRQSGTTTLSNLYRAIKNEGAKAGKPDFLVMGNDIPAFSLGWPRGDLDMVSTELTWGWWLTTGPRGIMPPPLGCYVPVYKLAREHAKSRFVNVWMYGPPEAKSKPGIADVLYYQALANHTLPMPQFGGNTLGNGESEDRFFKFVRDSANDFGARTPIEEVGIYYSSSSQVMEMLPGGFRNHDDQKHSFSFYGWGAALTWMHIPWRAVPEWKLNEANLDKLRLLVVPSADVFPATSVPILTRWLKRGGRVIVAGQCGIRKGEESNFERSADGSTLAPLKGTKSANFLSEDPGLEFYRADKTRLELLKRLEKTVYATLKGTPQLAISAPGVPWTVGLTPYMDGNRVLIDVNNTEIDMATDRIAPAGPITFSVVLPASLRGKPLEVRLVAPDVVLPSATISKEAGNRAKITLVGLNVYACAIIRAR